MSDGFAKHGIQRLSPSSVNAWIDNPTIWCLKYLGKARDDVGPKAHRGTAVERGVEFLLRGAPMARAVSEAELLFNHLCLGEVNEAVAQHIPAMLEQANQWRIANELDLAATQLKVQTWLDGVDIPFIGFIDFTFIGDFPDTDLKTTERLELQRAHVRQVALYARARKHPASLLYVTPKKHQHFVISEDDCAAALSEFRSAALSLERFLSRVDDAQDALHLLPFDTSHWKVNQQLIDAHAELIGAHHA